MGDLVRSPGSAAATQGGAVAAAPRRRSRLTPDAETVLAPDDELLFAGAGSERRELESTLVVDSTGAYVLFDQHIPSSWVWRKLSRKSSTPSKVEDRGGMTSPRS